jgi:hypothetical protein
VGAWKAESRRKLVFFVNFNDRFTAIAAAIFANTVCQMIFAAALALNQMIQRKRVVCAAAVTPTFGNFSFR